MNVAIMEDVVILESLIIMNAKFIVEITPGEVQIEMRLIEIKNSIIISIINFQNRIIDSNSAVSKGRIQFALIRAAGNDRNFCLIRKLLILRKTAIADEDKEQQDFSHKIKFDTILKIRKTD